MSDPFGHLPSSFALFVRARLRALGNVAQDIAYGIRAGLKWLWRG